jgi:predicted HicB family RNase H-like nuclease
MIIELSPVLLTPEVEKASATKVESRKPMSDAKKRANKKWNAANLNQRYDHVHLVLDNGLKSQLQAHAKAHGESLNGFINRAISETVERDTALEKVAAAESPDKPEPPEKPAPKLDLTAHLQTRPRPQDR